MLVDSAHPLLPSIPSEIMNRLQIFVRILVIYEIRIVLIFLISILLFVHYLLMLFICLFFKDFVVFTDHLRLKPTTIQALFGNVDGELYVGFDENLDRLLRPPLHNRLLTHWRLLKLFPLLWTG